MKTRTDVMCWGCFNMIQPDAFKKGTAFTKQVYAFCSRECEAAFRGNGGHCTDTRQLTLPFPPQEAHA